MVSKFPCWLRGQDAHIAKALIYKGFWYVGKAEEFTASEMVDRVEGFELCLCHCENLLDCVVDGALFCFQLNGTDSPATVDPLALVGIGRRAIKAAAAEWRDSIGFKQLELPL